MQIGFTIGLLFIFGWLIYLCNKLFYANFGTYGSGVCYLTGIIGTPVHELSHALFCLIFGHKIIEMKLFQISDDGTLGYVSHSYDANNIYHRIGNFFIGIAPMVVISLLLYLFSQLLIPSFAEAIRGVSDSVSAFDSATFFGAMKKAFQIFFLKTNDFRWWIFLLISMFLSLHASLSNADIKGMMDGLAFVLLIVFLVDLVICLVNRDILFFFTKKTIEIGAVFFGCLCIMLGVSLVEVLISFAFKLKSKIKIK